MRRGYRWLAGGQVADLLVAATMWDMLRLGILLLCSCMKVSCLRGGAVLARLQSCLQQQRNQSASKKSMVGLRGFWILVAGYKWLNLFSLCRSNLWACKATQSQILVACAGSRWQAADGSA